MTIVPDTKDWTWVLQRPCPECGLDTQQEGPQYPNWDQDGTAVADRYHEQDPATVAAELAEAAGAIALHFEALSPGQWQRTGTRGDGAHFTVESFARYFIHDPVHHLYDLTGVPYAGPARPAS